jgi:peptidoglycan/LPS O-acetylase OafA/YrhL
VNRTGTSKLAPKYRPDVDGLRAVAILSVVFCHAGVRWLSGGFTGVDIFFVISGYLIGGHIYGEVRQGNFSYLEFYRRRAKRILPALYVVLGFVAVGGALLLTPLEFRVLGACVTSTVFSASNFYLLRLQDYFNPSSALNPLLMTWSLGVEEQFYLIIPLLMVLLSRLRPSRVLQLIGVVAVTSFTISWIQLASNPPAAFYLLHARAWELAVGVGLAILESDSVYFPLRKLNIAANAVAACGLLLLAIPFFAYTSLTRFPGPSALPSVLGTAMVIASPGSWINARMLSFRPVVFIGRASYSYYLWHWPLFAFMRVLNGGDLPLSWGLIGAVVAFGLATLTYYIVEQPFRASKRPAVTLLCRYAAVSACFVVLGLGIFLARGFIHRFPVLATVDADSVELRNDRCGVGEGSSKPVSSPACSGTGPGSKVALWGDSQAMSMASALRQVSVQHGYGFVEMSKTACEPFVGAALNFSNRPLHLQQCLAFNDEVMRRLLEDRTVKIVLLIGNWGGAFEHSDSRIQYMRLGEPVLLNGGDQRSLQTLSSALRNVVGTLRSAGKSVVVFGNSPSFATDPAWRFSVGQMALRRNALYALRRSSASVDPGTDQPNDNSALQQQVRAVVKQAAESAPGVHYWDLRKPLCPMENECMYRDGERLFFKDDFHVNKQGSWKALEGWTFPGEN